jgi:hypothetical protein
MGAAASGPARDACADALGFPQWFGRNPHSDPGWFSTESGDGPGDATNDPGRSLRRAKVSAAYMLGR